MWDYMINFNQRTDPALQDPIVKKAIAYAIDKQQLVDIVRLGYGTATESFIPPEFFGPAYADPAAVTYEYNVFLANQMLDAAGYLDIDADGIREMPAPTEPVDEPEEPEVELEVIEALVSSVESLTTDVSGALAQVTAMEADLEALSARLNSSLNMSYGLAIVALIVAVVAVYFAMRSR